MRVKNQMDEVWYVDGGEKKCGGVVRDWWGKKERKKKKEIGRGGEK